MTHVIHSSMQSHLSNISWSAAQCSDFSDLWNHASSAGEHFDTVYPDAEAFLIPFDITCSFINRYEVYLTFAARNDEHNSNQNSRSTNAQSASSDATWPPRARRWARSTQERLSLDSGITACSMESDWTHAEFNFRQTTSPQREDDSPAWYGNELTDIPIDPADKKEWILRSPWTRWWRSCFTTHHTRWARCKSSLISQIWHGLDERRRNNNAVYDWQARRCAKDLFSHIIR